MYSENGVLVDFDEIKKLVDSADVFTVGFSTFSERLVVDSRSNEREAPMVQVVEPARGARERLIWLNRRRPSLGTPQSFSFFAWPHSPTFMVQSGVWESIRDRVEAFEGTAVGLQCDTAMRELISLERQAVVAVLRGDHCLQLWPREPRVPED
jgi:hypothetical protein